MELRIKNFFSDKKIQKRAIWVIAALVAFQLYFVRELLAALLLFTAVFMLLATIAFVVYLLDEGSRFSFERAVAVAKVVSHAIRQTWLRIEEITRKQLGRIRSAPAR